jgi:predicted amidohydrolase YtcJ
MSLPSAKAAIAMLAAASAMTIACSRPPRLAADLVITRANIWTGDAARPDAKALAIIGDRIVDVGSVDEIERWRGLNTTVIDARGRRVVPGFNDAHVHLVEGGMQIDNVDLKDAGSQAEFARRISERARARPGEWITGGDWDDRQWSPALPPARQLIDEVTNSSPVFVSRYDGHVALANSAALGRAGITERTPDPPGGVIVRDPATGFPTGILEDAAVDLVTRVIPRMTPEQRQRAVKRALEHAATLGVTSVQDMNPSYDDVAVYADLANRGELTARIYAAPMETGWYDQARLGVHRSFGSPWLRIGAVNGEIGTTRGLLSDETQDRNQMRTRLMAADHAGLQLCIRAIGDAGISRTLDLFGDLIRANGERDRRLRIEHAQHIAAADFDRVASLKVIASVQPYHAIDDGRWAAQRSGPERIRTTYAFRALLDKGVRLALGTDWPVAPLNPLLTVYAATTRATLDGMNPNGWVPEQKITTAEAVTAYTSVAAFAEFQEAEKGTLARGRLADLVILSDDIFNIPPAQIKDVMVLATLVGGKVVHQRNP